MEDMGNPFLEETRDLLTLDTKYLMSEDVVETIASIREIGNAQYETYVDERLRNPNKPIADNIHKNNLPLFGTHLLHSQSKVKHQVASLKNDCALFSHPYMACQSRIAQLDDFFCHENQASQPALSDMGKLCHGDKFDMLLCPVIPVRIKQPTSRCKKYLIDQHRYICFDLEQKYAENLFKAYILSQLEPVQIRVDVVWDRYITSSLKRALR